MIGKLGAFLVGFIIIIVPFAVCNGIEGPGVIEQANGRDAVIEQIPLDPGASHAISDLEPFFTENLGQRDDDGVMFHADGEGISVAFTREGVLYDIDRAGGSAHFELGFGDGYPVSPVGQGVFGHRVNYLIGNDPSRWVRNAASFESIVYQNVYDGVDVRFHFQDGMLKYDVIVDAGIDVGTIILEYRGVDGWRIDPESGDMLIDTSAGTLRDARPVFLQEGLDGGAPGDYLLMEDGRFTFRVPEGISLDLPLVVDPGIEFATLLGGSAEDQGLMVSLDPAGDIIIGGQTNSTDMPTTAEANQTAIVGFWDGFCAKYDPTGSDLKFMTYFGGTLNDNAFDMEVRPDGSIWFVGMTYSRDFPVTDDALFADFLGGYVDGFLIKLSNDGSDLLYSTYIGGSFSENLRSLEFDDVGNIYMAGVTNSWDIPTTAGAFCMTRTDSSWDLNSGWVVRVNSSLGGLDYCTYINDMAADSQSLYPWLEIAVDGNGRIYLASATDKATFPVTGGAFCTTKRAGYIDAVVLALDPTGSTLLYSTFLGGDGEDSTYFIDVGDDGLVYVSGYTNSTDYPTTSDAISSTYSMYQDAVLTVLEGDLSALEYSTYFGGNGGDVGISTTVSSSGELFFLYGISWSSDLSTTTGCFDPYKRGYEWDPDCFVAAFSTTDHSLKYSTYFGGSLIDAPSNKGLLCDGDGDLFLIGGTTSLDFPTTPGANQSSVVASMDVFLAKLSPAACGPPDAPEGLVATPGDGQVNLTWDPYLENQYRILKYIIHRKTDGDLEPVNETYWPFPGWFVDEDLENGVNYTYAISAVNSVGEGVMSDLVQVRPLGLPNATQNLTLTSGDGTVKLEWSAPNYTGGALDGYVILKGRSPDNLTVLVQKGPATFWRDWDLVLGETYYYAVVAYNEAGNGSLGRVVAIKALDVPTNPRGFGSMVGDQRVDLYWDRPESDGGSPVDGYRLYRGPEPWDMVLLEDMDQTHTTYSDTGLENGRKYYYAVSAYSSAGLGRSSTPLLVIPFTLPGEPRALTVMPGDDQMLMSWTPPIDDGGRPISGYMVHFGEGSTILTHSFEVDNITSHIHTGLTNGVVYYYAISALNEAGSGPVGDIAAGTPMGLPGPPTDELAVSDIGTVRLSWTPPADMGGATSLLYSILRGISSDAVDDVLVELQDEVEHIDDTVEVGMTYYYRIEAVNSIGGTSTEAMAVAVTTLPGPVSGLVLGVGDGYVQITWQAPDSDGASPVTGYSILRGPTDTELIEIALVTTKLQHNDTGVINGQRYLYSVRAVTDVGTGPRFEPILAEPQGRPSVPGTITVDVKDGNVVISWTEPTGEGMATVTGYRIYRGTSTGERELYATLGDGLTYTDKDVKAGRTYYYSIIADSDFGSGQMSSEYKASIGSGDEGFPLIYLLLVLVLIIIIAVLVVAASRRGKEVGPEVLVEEGKAQYIVEEAFVVLQDGKLITHGTRAEDEEADVSMMSGMLIAVQGIMQDGLEREGALESIKYGDNLIQIATGQHVNVVAVVYGTPDEALMDEMQAVVQSIEATYAGVIEDWVGDLTLLEGINEMVEPLLFMTEELTREDVARAAVTAGVSLQSAVDFHRGYVRLKVAAVNASDEAVMDAGVDAHYDRDLLRLDKVEPAGITLRGDKAEVGNLMAGERKALAFLFDPQICQDTYLDGTLTYYDPKGELKHVEMKRRHAKVVCPIFFTKEHANTAMLRRLIKEKLHLSDARIFRYPGSIKGGDLLEVGKRALGGIDVQLVREFVSLGPPFEGEVWYYGETQVKGYQIVMRLGVLAEKEVLEFFAASTDMEPLTGLLAEFRRELEGAMQERFPGTPTLEPEVDADVRFEVEARPLRIDEVIEAEEDG